MHKKFKQFLENTDNEEKEYSVEGIGSYTESTIKNNLKRKFKDLYTRSQSGTLEDWKYIASLRSQMEVLEAFLNTLHGIVGDRFEDEEEIE